MSYYTRLGSTDEQEQAIAHVERAFKKANTNIGGATTIGKAPQTVILDVYHNDSKIYINHEGVIKINDEIMTTIPGMAMVIQSIRDAGRNPSEGQKAADKLAASGCCGGGCGCHA